MLKNVCDRCGKVIEGDGNMPDYNAFDAYFDDAPVVSYIHLCDKCREKVMDILMYNIEGKKRPKKETPKKDVSGKSPKVKEQKPLPDSEDDAIVNNYLAERKLAEKVVKRVALPEPRQTEATTPLFDD